MQTFALFGHMFQNLAYLQQSIGIFGTSQSSHPCAFLQGTQAKVSQNSIAEGMKGQSNSPLMFESILQIQPP
ncbi:hypothetical protein FGO68_gene3530 [Halteria grandinella]|uniref:Uncharacterized protein n=1 Tax=Halteria grandinella TaxID=5974 RepID=A0A8J8P3C5_HALGN|nr:hypothetical protein FGO68_gene3530 [Halteria grandinella]